MTTINIIIMMCIGAQGTPPPVCAEEVVSDAPAKDASVLDLCIQIEHKTRFQLFVLTRYKPNYVPPITDNKAPNNASVDTLMTESRMIKKSSFN